ncbi:MAG: FeS-binding protein [Chloroflexi bacterium]|nr:NIL domain-containing protein [Chloroflexota bacterium]MDA1148099.1 NIL domain-containing protein [Chloroflexota bacterium]MQC82325.1 FeS-binding protein [Chloroflexota bacterium]
MASRHIRFTFSGDQVKRPLIYELGHQFKVVTNIRMADVGQTTGWVVLEIEGDDDEIKKSLAWAREQGARVDEATLGDVVEG